MSLLDWIRLDVDICVCKYVDMKCVVVWQFYAA